MANISQIKLPSGTTYDLQDNLKTGIYTVKGTQTATTATWTGNIDVFELFDGLTIAYYLPRTSASNVTLTLTLADGTTTAAIPVYYTGTSRMSTQYTAGSTVFLTYWSSGSILVNGTATTENRWTSSDYNTNDTTIMSLYRNPQFRKAGVNGVKQTSLIMEDSTGCLQSLTIDSGTGTTKTKNPSAFLLPNIWYYNGSGNITAGNVIGSGYYLYEGFTVDFRYSANSGSTLTNLKAVYLVGSIGDNGYFYLADTWWTQDLPTTEDGKVYVFVGPAYSTTQVSLAPYHPCYIYKNGGIRLYSGYAETESLWQYNSSSDCVELIFPN